MRDHSQHAAARVETQPEIESVSGPAAAAPSPIAGVPNEASESSASAPALPPASDLLPAELSIIIPTRNERGNVEPMVAALTRALGAIRWEVIFVDDDSQDGTMVAVKQIAQRDPRVRGIRRLRRRGLAGAVIEGMLSSAAPLIAVMDGDLQHDPAVLPRMLGMLETEQADLVVATRHAEEGTHAADPGLSPQRQRGSDLANALARRLLHVELSDPMSGFFLVRRSIVEQVAPSLSSQGFKIFLDIVASAPRDLRVRECTYEFAPRQAGESKLDLLVVLEYLGLLLSKMTNDTLSVRFILFGLVGGSGVAVNIVALWLLLLVGTGFTLAQFSATTFAMLSNYLLNNTLTYRDRRRHGWRLLTGFASFAAICSIGVVANVGLATVIYNWGQMWLLAGLAGAFVGSVWNYAATSAVTWGK